MSYSFGKKKFSEEPIPQRNDQWITANRNYFKEWCFKKHHRMGNSKGSLEAREVFYQAGYDSASLALRYASIEPKSTTGRPLNYNTFPEQFKADLEGLYSMLCELRSR